MSATEKAIVVVNGTTYDARTPRAVVDVIETSRVSGKRIHIAYGFTESADGKPLGRNWLEENDVTGTVSRSMGPQKIPILLENSRSDGGCGILDHCIVRIRERSGRVLYQHPQYHAPILTLRTLAEPIPAKRGPLTVEVCADGEPRARFKNVKAAAAWALKMGVTIA